MREHRRRIHQQAPVPTVSLLAETGQAREQALKAEPVLPSLQPSHPRQASPGAAPPAQASGSHLHHFSTLPSGSSHPYAPDLPIERQTHVWIQPAIPRWNSGPTLPLQRQEDLGGQIAARLGHGIPLQPDVRATLEGGLGGDSSPVVVQRKVDHLGKDYVSNMVSLTGQWNDSTMNQLDKAYREYLKAPLDKELLLIDSMLSLVDKWVTDHERDTEKTSKGELDKLRTLTGALRKDRIELYNNPQLRETVDLVSLVGLPKAYVKGMKPRDFSNLMQAHLAMGAGDVGKADTHLADLRASIGDAVNLIRSSLIRHHLGEISPDLDQIINNAKYQLKDKKKNLDSSSDPAFKRLLDAVSAEYASRRQTASKKEAVRLDNDLQDIAKTALKKQSEDPSLKNLTPKEITAIVAYTSDIFAVFNDPLREDVGTTKFDTAKLGLTQLTVSALNKLPLYDGTSYRHTGFFPGYKEFNQPGAIVTDMAPLSTAEQVAACGNAAKKHDVLEIIKGRGGRRIAGASIFGKGEAEVLFKPGTRFRVVSCYELDEKASQWNPDPPADVVAALRADTKAKSIKMIVVKQEV